MACALKAGQGERQQEPPSAQDLKQATHLQVPHLTVHPLRNQNSASNANGAVNQ